MNVAAAAFCIYVSVRSIHFSLFFQFSCSLDIQGKSEKQCWKLHSVAIWERFARVMHLSNAFSILVMRFSFFNFYLFLFI